MECSIQICCLSKSEVVMVCARAMDYWEKRVFKSILKRLNYEIGDPIFENEYAKVRRNPEK